MKRDELFEKLSQIENNLKCGAIKFSSIENILEQLRSEEEYILILQILRLLSFEDRQAIKFISENGVSFKK